MAYRRTRRVYAEIAVIPILFLAAALVTRARYRDDLSLMEHTRQVESGINRVLAVLSDTETARRGFILTADPHYLAEVDAAGPEIAEAVRRLDSLTEDNPVVQQHVRVLERLATQRAQLLKETSRSGRSGDNALQTAEERTGLAISEQLRDVVTKMTADQDQLYRSRTRASDLMAWGEIILIVAGGTATILLLLWASRIAQEYAGERDRAETILVEANQQLHAKIGEVDELNRGARAPRQRENHASGALESRPPAVRLRG